MLVLNVSTKMISSLFPGPRAAFPLSLSTQVPLIMRAHFVFDVFLLKPYTDNPFFIESEESYTTQLIGKTMSLTTVLGNQQKVSMHLTQKGPGKVRAISGLLR